MFSKDNIFSVFPPFNHLDFLIFFNYYIILKAYREAYTLFSVQLGVLCHRSGRLGGWGWLGRLKDFLGWNSIELILLKRTSWPFIKYLCLSFNISHYTALNINLEKMIAQRGTDMKYSIIRGK